MAGAMRNYDLVMTHKLDADDFFIHRVQQHCAERALNFFLIEPIWVEAFYREMFEGRVGARVLLNMHSEHHEPEDIYHRLVRLAFDRGTEVIDPPDVALGAFDKAALHPRLAQAGFRLPYSIIVSAAAAGQFALSEDQAARLGSPFVIKPALGYGKRGVILDAVSSADLARSRTEWPNGDYLVQERIVPRVLGGVPAYFRVFYAFGSAWHCWWNCYTDRYRAVSRDEMESYGLQRLEDLVRRLAGLTRMNFFSTEIALTEAGEFVLIDYVNDQCHMLTQSANPSMGVPDEIVAAMARHLVEGARQLAAGT